MDTSATKIKDEVKKIKIEDFYLNSCEWVEPETFLGFFEISKQLKILLNLSDSCFMVEYWKDKNIFHYFIENGDEVEFLTNIIECEYLNKLVLNIANIKGVKYIEER